VGISDFKFEISDSVELVGDAFISGSLVFESDQSRWKTGGIARCRVDFAAGREVFGG